MSESVLPMFSSRSFSFWSYVRSLIHFEFILVYGVRKCSSFILLQVVDQFSQHHLLKRLSLIHWEFLLLFHYILNVEEERKCNMFWNFPKTKFWHDEKRKCNIISFIDSIVPRVKKLSFIHLNSLIEYQVYFKPCAR